MRSGATAAVEKIEMEAGAYLFELLAGVAYLVVGARLIRLGLRTGEAPERLLGSYFLLAGLSYLLYEIPIILDGGGLYTPLTFAGRVVYDVGVIPLLFFLHRVFRRGAGRASPLVAVCGSLVLAGLIGSTTSGDYEGTSIASPWFWLEWTGYTLPFAWLMVDSLRGYARGRRRMRIGLTDALAVHRYLLWGLFGAAQAAGGLALIPMYIEYAERGIYSTWSDAVVGGAEIVSLGVLWLVFFAPAPYRRWLSSFGSVATEAS